MARDPKIRISERDKREYQRLRKNTLSKIRRTQKKYDIDLSSKVSLPSLSSFQTRKEFNKWKEEQRWFTNVSNTEFQFVKNPYEVVESKKELNKIKRNVKKAQRVADKKIKEVEKKPTFHKGKKVGTVGQRMDMYYNEADVHGIHRMKDFNFNEVRNKRRLDDIRESAEKRKDKVYYDKRNEQMKENFIEMLEKEMTIDVSDLVDEIRSINPDDFYGLYLSHFTIFNFVVYYKRDDEVEIMQGQKEAMLGVLKNFKESDLY